MSEKFENRSERMSEFSLSEASNLLRQVAGNRRADESKKAVLRRVGRLVKDWTPSRIKDVWYCDKRVRISVRSRTIASAGQPARCTES